MFANFGEDLAAVLSQGDVAGFEYLGPCGLFEDIVEVFGEQFAVLHSEGADGVVV